MVDQPGNGQAASLCIRWIQSFDERKNHSARTMLPFEIQGNSIKPDHYSPERGYPCDGRNGRIFQRPWANVRFHTSAVNKVFARDIEQRVRAINDQTLRANIGRISLKSVVSRWGSCSPDNNIMISNRLLLAPTEILDHVIIHELAHTVHRDHSRQFWRVVAQYDPAMKEKNDWLKQNGHTLNYWCQIASQLFGGCGNDKHDVPYLWAFGNVFHQQEQSLIVTGFR